jgi:tetratricopeptide (TPR) repeat protein
VSFKEFQSIQLPGDLKLLGPTLQQKLVAMTNTRQAYQAVVLIGDPVWSVAALGRLGSVDAAGAAAMRSLALPEDLPEEMAKQVRGALESNAAPLAKESAEAVKQCAATARKLKVLSAAAQDCLAGKAPDADPQASFQVAPIKRARPRGAAELERALARNPRDLELITRLAQAHLAADNPYMARMVLGKGLELRETAPLLNLLGVTLARLGEPQTALDLFDSALKNSPAHPFARYNKAYLLQRYGYAKAAAAEARKIRGGQSFGAGDPRLIPGAELDLGGAR